jgi:predicted RNase H-like nuclease (RuvC/YqgF family)
MTHDKIQDLKAEENFIARLKKQKEKMEILNTEFQQQDTLISEQEHLIKTLTASNNQLKSNLEELSQKVEVL